MRPVFILASLLLLAAASDAAAQGRDRSDRALGAEISRDRAETRIERMQQDREQKSLQSSTPSPTLRAPAERTPKPKPGQQ